MKYMKILQLIGNRLQRSSQHFFGEKLVILFVLTKMAQNRSLQHGAQDLHIWLPQQVLTSPSLP